MEKVVIIGSGCPATPPPFTPLARIYARWSSPANNRAVLLTTTTIVENYPAFPEGMTANELMVRMQKQAERFALA